MVNILQRPPSFGEIIGRGLGGGVSQGIGSGLQFAQQMALTGQKQQHRLEAQAQKQQSKLEAEMEKKLQEREDWENTFDTLEKNLDYTGAATPGKAFFKHFPASKAAQKNEEFDVAAFQLERYARAEHTKGTLSKAVYESLLSKLPDSKLSNSRNRGRINEWKKVILKNQEKQESGKKNKKKRSQSLDSFYEQ